MNYAPIKYFDQSLTVEFVELLVVVLYIYN